MRDYVMKLQRLLILSAAALMVLAIGAPEAVLAATTATERIVYQPSTDSCTSSNVDPLKECYTTIGSAIEAADETLGDFITIKPGTYTTEPLTLSTNVSISGTETTRCIISGGGSGPIITVSSSSASGLSIRRLTFTSATTGIKISNSNSINITNNVFRVGSTAVSVEGTSSADIINNTFYQNSVGVSFVSGATVDIENNIFYGNGTGTTAISSTASASVHQYNCFFNITAGQTDTVGTVTTDPSFVDPDAGSAGDFHLQSGSDCIDAGTSSKLDPSFYPDTRSDMGAYGGPDTDTIPFAVADFKVTSSTLNSITTTWSANKCYLVKGYNVYYDSDKSGPPYDGIDAKDTDGITSLLSPINAGNVTTYTLSGLEPAAATPGTPTGLTSEPATQKLILSWNPVSGATGYYVYHDPGTCLVACSPPTTVENTNTNSYVLDGLQDPDPDPHCYCVTVSAYAQATYYLAVKAYYVATDSSKESLAYSNEEKPSIGPVLEGATFSPTLNDYPEPITAYPNLPNKGCFIATAAYGYYSAPQVQALREFRDRYLMTTTPGRAFVGWYYTYSPIAAQFINEHPGLKPAVRVALLPAVRGAMFMTRTSTSTKTILFVVLGLLALYASLRAGKTRRT